MMESNSWVEDSVNSKEVDQQKDDKNQIIEENKIAPVSIYWKNATLIQYNGNVKDYHQADSHKRKGQNTSNQGSKSKF